MSYFNQVQPNSLGLNLIQSDRDVINHESNRIPVLHDERSMLDQLHNARTVFEHMQIYGGCRPEYLKSANLNSLPFASFEALKRNHNLTLFERPT